MQFKGGAGIKKKQKKQETACEKKQLLPGSQITWSVGACNDEWGSVLQNNVFWKHLIAKAVATIYTVAQSQLK